MDRERETRASARAVSGFSVLEVVVALMLLTLALAGIVHSIGYGAIVAGSARRSRMAREHVLEVARADEAVAPGDWSEIAGAGAIPCRRRVLEVGAASGDPGTSWQWVEVVCAPETSAEATGWQPGRAALLVPR